MYTDVETEDSTLPRFFPIPVDASPDDLVDFAAWVVARLNQVHRADVSAEKKLGLVAQLFVDIRASCLHILSSVSVENPVEHR